MKLNKLLLLGLSLTICSCNGTSNKTTNQNTSTPKASESTVVEKEKEYLLDNKFKNGFSILPADKSFDNGTMPENRWPLESQLRYNNNEKEPIMWEVGQHGCKYGLGDIYNLTTENKPTFENGYYTFADTSKKLSVNPTTGSLLFELNATSEYEKPRINMEGWPHLIIQQGFKEAAILNELESFDLSIDIEMKKLVNGMDDATYNEGLHTIQFIMYLIVKSNTALDAGEFLWFGIPFYDYRYKVMYEHGQADAGTAGNTGKFIYQMPTTGYLPNGLTVGKKEEIRIDLVENLKRAIVLANENGYMTNTTVNDLVVSGMNIGFEIPGTFDCGIEISNFSLFAKKK